MSTKLKDLFVRDDTKEPEAAPADTVSSSSESVTVELALKEKMQLSPSKVVEKEEDSKEVSVSADTDAAAALDVSTSQVDFQVPEKHFEKSNDMPSGYIVLEGPKIIQKRAISEEPLHSPDVESFKTAELYLSSADKGSPKKVTVQSSVEKNSDSSSESEKESSPEVNGGGRQEPRVQHQQSSNEINIVFDKVQAVKIIPSLKAFPSVGVNLDSLDNVSPGVKSISESGAMVDEAWERLNKSYVLFKGKPVGTLAAMDPGAEALNYNQVFVRDFVPSGLACLMKNPSEPEIVKNFLLKTLHLQGREKRIDNFTLGEGVMPASYKVLYDSHREKDILVADFGGSAIGRVAPVDSGFWWIILLRSYTKSTHDYALAELPEVQKGMKLILNLCLSDGFDTFPTLLCADGCSMIDRRMGIYGYPIEIQALFYFALRCAQQLLKPERDGKELLERIDKRITALSFHIQKYYWLDFTQLNNIYRYKTEEYSHTAVNKFNVIPESIPDWVFDFMPLRGGYLIGNVSPARMDFRWFLVGNCIAILSSLATPAQATAIMELIEERWEDLIGEMPLKITYPALEGHEWRTVTGYDPKNTRWSYHNGGSWPVLLWLLAAASIKVGRPQIAKRAVELVEQRLSKDGWPEYYDGKTGRYVGKQARKYQTWSIAGYLVAKMMIENPSNLLIISLEEDKKIAKPTLTRSASF
ncbi:probable alkaline/neutral invertase F [Ricinus communis]|uniref:Alkaline/neutral invertase n=1 Tax=Ricinus communis TaxID=3988 RepID=B9SGC0_RICCO|nr:probable alkaline/neutral invertase F [Ricinus communis]EEF37366.1 beta-fructofuranosidase, putative [Ricinus communis]|eukprot:XP_002525039.1 probable alkaline/neutral invertase F [Ricinus communis]